MAPTECNRRQLDNVHFFNISGIIDTRDTTSLWRGEGPFSGLDIPKQSPKGQLLSQACGAVVLVQQTY